MADSDPTASIGPDPAPGTPRLPGSIGPYHVLGVLGDGGFGVVYEAEQREPVRRRVAIKVIKPGMDSEAVVARFEAERQALAVMDHPCIARIFDGGLTGPELGSRPYFVMELVKGVPITEHCDTQQLTINERCELFIRVCEAVQHAHAKGVVHRDLKPSNVLVAYDADGNAIPKVIDFGVAKALNSRLSERTIFTERGQIIGTPEYMSPEQAEMSGQDIDTRADVYSLGVMLYELLTGVLPFDPKTLREAAFAEIHRIIRETDPPRPSTRLSTMLGSGDAADRVKQIVKARKADARAIAGVLKRDLDWVIMRSLEKDRNRRYQTATALGEELRRYLSSEPVDAGPPGVRYRVGKLVARNRIAVVTGLVMCVVLLAGLGGTSFGLLEAREARLAAQNRTSELVELVEFALLPPLASETTTASDFETVRRLEKVAEGAFGKDDPRLLAVRINLAHYLYFEWASDPSERKRVFNAMAAPLVEAARSPRLQELGERDVRRLVVLIGEMLANHGLSAELVSLSQLAVPFGISNHVQQVLSMANGWHWSLMSDLEVMWGVPRGRLRAMNQPRSFFISYVADDATADVEMNPIDFIERVFLGKDRDNRLSVPHLSESAESFHRSLVATVNESTGLNLVATYGREEPSPLTPP